jgi:predicted transcriptional regulator
MAQTTIQIQTGTKERLETVKTHPRETYDEVVNRLLDMACDQEPLSEETLQKIEEGIRDIRQGKTRTLEEISEELGI